MRMKIVTETFLSSNFHVFSKAFSHKFKSRPRNHFEVFFKMDFQLFFGVFLCVTYIYCNNTTTESDDEEFENEFNHTDDDYSEHEKGKQTNQTTARMNNSSSIITTTEAPYFSEMPETMKIEYIDPITLIRFDNKGEKMMGVSDDKCDNGRVSESEFWTFQTS